MQYFKLSIQHSGILFYYFFYFYSSDFAKINLLILIFSQSHWCFGSTGFAGCQTNRKSGRTDPALIEPFYFVIPVFKSQVWLHVLVFQLSLSALFLPFVRQQQGQ